MQFRVSMVSQITAALACVSDHRCADLQILRPRPSADPCLCWALGTRDWVKYGLNEWCDHAIAIARHKEREREREREREWILNDTPAQNRKRLRNLPREDIQYNSNYI